ncbi:ATP-binding cassette domain-containing protein [Schnuerera ultunensis]|uniref:ATPase component of tungstate ABC transporter n=1 Tax=[Clostridium] ultunense Esp TaxID=1288971 RepID=A0A1M4PRQ7_9FIRM
MEITIFNLKKTYSEREILNIEDLKIERGKITGLIGPNGSGKTTLLNILSGLDKDFSGIIRYDGKLLDGGIYKKMTLVSQKPYLFRRKVYENIEYPLKVRGINKDERKRRSKEDNEKVWNRRAKG